MWFDSFDVLWRTVAVGAAAYVTLVVLLRVTGKRTLSKLNAFDFVVTVALGSTLAAILVDADIAWAEGAVALAVLVLLQLLVTWLSTLSGGRRSVLTARPTVLIRDGSLREDALQGQRVTRSEIAQAVRQSGVGGLDMVAAVVLETDGTLSVITADQLGDGSAVDEIDEPG
jgi:uncharacterized membrane protein YcaP (DUF421 family)